MVFQDILEALGQRWTLTHKECSKTPPGVWVAAAKDLLQCSRCMEFYGYKFLEEKPPWWLDSVFGIETPAVRMVLVWVEEDRKRFLKEVPEDEAGSCERYRPPWEPPKY